MNKKFAKIIIAVLLIVLIIASVAFYVADLIVNNTPATRNLFKAMVAVFICLGALVRHFQRGQSTEKRKSLEYYDSLYHSHINDAFADQPVYKKKLLVAIRLYNEDKYDKAMKYLLDLRSVSRTREDIYAVGLFTGLTLTDMECYSDAITVYNCLVEMEITSSTVYGNLGNIHLKLGNHHDAITYIRLAIQNDENNPAPYNNLAKLYFEISDFENAKIYAQKALELNHKMYQASTLLAIIYTMEGDKRNADKYSHMAISSGRHPAELKEIIEYYMTAGHQDNNGE